MGNKSSKQQFEYIVKDPSYSVHLIKDGLFPSFYMDSNHHLDQLNSWIDKIYLCKKEGLIFLPPAIIIDPPKAGKTAFMKRFAPYFIKERFSKCCIIYLDMMEIPLNTYIMLSDNFGLFLSNFCQKINKSLQGQNINLSYSFDINSAEISVKNFFTIINKYFFRKNMYCFFLLDEIQRWFQIMSDRGAYLFDNLSLHMHYSNLLFMVTGSSMVFIFNNILKFPSNGTLWSSEMHVISLSPGLSQTATLTLTDSTLNEIELSSIEYEDQIATKMVELLLKYHPDITPNNVLEFLPERSPAIIAYFCYLHKTNDSTEKSMKKTLALVYDKLFDDFKKDLLPVLKEISINLELFKQLIMVATGTMVLVDANLNSLGRWLPLFTSVIRVKNNLLQISGYYGYFIMRSIDVEDGNFKLKTIRSYNKLPVPGLWATAVFVHSILENMEPEKRSKANELSLNVFNNDDVIITEWVAYQSYVYFFNANYPKKALMNPISNPYLEYLHIIQNSISLIRSLSKIREINSNLPNCFPEWIRALLNFITN